jgi:sulfate adenylyltransferase
MPNDLLVSEADAATLKAQSNGWPSWDLTPRQTCDLELLLNGGFAPLKGFLTRDDDKSVREKSRLVDGTLWPVPILLEVSRPFAAKLKTGGQVALRDAEGVMLAVLRIDDVWSADDGDEGIPVCLGGPVLGLELPEHHDYRSLRHTPDQLRLEFAQRGWRKIVAFQTFQPVHRAEFEMTKRIALEHRANLLIQPVIGFTHPGERDHFGRVRCHQAILPHYPSNLAALSLLPLSVRETNDRSALLQAIIQRNFGCTHVIAPDDDDALAALKKHEKEIGVEVIPYRKLVYSEEQDDFVTKSESANRVTKEISDADLETRLAEGREIPTWFTFPDVADELRKTHPPRSKQGFTVFFTGLSGSGKSTAAKALWSKFLEIGGRSVTLLDGDIVRKNLSSELGFSKAHRNLNILRIGFVANEITKNGGIAICAPIAPYDAIRKEVRELISQHGGFILVHLSTPLDVCEGRDRKGLYAKARAGIVKEFTGISDPYETPADAEVVLNTDLLNVEECCQEIRLHLERKGYIGARL